MRWEFPISPAKRVTSHLDCLGPVSHSWIHLETKQKRAILTSGSLPGKCSLCINRKEKGTTPVKITALLDLPVATQTPNASCYPWYRSTETDSFNPPDPSLYISLRGGACHHSGRIQSRGNLEWVFISGYSLVGPEPLYSSGVDPGLRYSEWVQEPHFPNPDTTTLTRKVRKFSVYQCSLVLPPPRLVPLTSRQLRPTPTAGSAPPCPLARPPPAGSAPARWLRSAPARWLPPRPRPMAPPAPAL